MKKITCALALTALLLMMFTGCSSSGPIEIKDGTYRAEYSDYDQHGYKDFVEITFEGGKAVSVTADAVSSKDGSLKSESVDYRSAMEPIQGTYPEKYYKDLINQYLENPSSDAIDVVAGATSTSNGFIELLRALEKAVRTGDTETVVIDR